MSGTEQSRQNGVTVYTTPPLCTVRCGQAGSGQPDIVFAEIDPSSNLGVLDKLKADGWQRTPIVQTGDGQILSFASCQKNLPRL